MTRGLLAHQGIETAMPETNAWARLVEPGMPRY